MDSSCVNRVLLVGKIESETVTGGFRIFTIITPERIRKREQVTFHDEYHRVKVPMQVCDEQFQPGERVHVKGSIRTQVSLDREGIRRYETSVVAAEFWPMDR
ncbi:single-stranded DNA-binding protein [Mucilaginibacter endophyticus]|uniref:single-stranded DNA-binding protein n=1 Tax=Mucilaginibacter endophyticus TaxID=2675003 RepID=UPI000E0CC649|nr:single-stranded DNA-binding protein [Mucilaginibacter endophyticus]